MARIDWMTRVYGDGRHNAFTDLVRWKGHTYVCFRHGAGHLSMDGVIKVLRSANLRDWEQCGELATLGDDRDPKFTASEDDLKVYFFTADLRHDGKTGTPQRGVLKSHFCATTDGKRWSKPRAVYDDDCCLWRVEKFGDTYYSAAYETLRREGREESQLKFLESPDGVNWFMVSLISDRGAPNETALFRRPDGHMLAVTRREGEALTGERTFLFESDPPYRHWEGACLGTVIHSPAIVEAGGQLIVAGRNILGAGTVKNGAPNYTYDDTTLWRTTLWRLEGHAVTELLTVPSGGDTAYPGLVADGDDAVLMSWYSMHENQTKMNWAEDTASIYLARITL